MAIKFIAAIDQQRGIGKNGKLPWDLPNDRAQFYEKVRGTHTLMGSRTYSELNETFKNHASCTVFSKRNQTIEGVQVIDDPVTYVKNLTADAWVIGGGEIYKLLLPFAAELHITQIRSTFDCDAFFPEFKSEFELAEESDVRTENDIAYTFQIWKSIN